MFYHLASSQGKKGNVIGIEHIPELTEWSEANLRNDGLADALDSKDIQIVTGDGRLGKHFGMYVHDIDR